VCGLGKKATINDPMFRSVNRNATAGSIYDIYKHNPWRAPGSAPTVDACGLAGGTPFLKEGTEAGDYSTTKYAHHGTYGSTLPPMDTGVKWKIGGTAEVTWQVLNNRKLHPPLAQPSLRSRLSVFPVLMVCPVLSRMPDGGGYSYRLCPFEAKLTEECFQKTHLDFVHHEQAIVDRHNKLFPINVRASIARR
jgi:hypothetical protein